MPYAAHPHIALPDQQTRIWRFMSLSKFLSLLTTSTLYFCQTLSLRAVDPFEGSLTRINRNAHEILTSTEQIFRAWLQLKEDQPTPDLRFFSPEGVIRVNDMHAALTYVNCWHVNEHESAFLWKNYTDQADGVAIVTTVQRLLDSLATEPRGIEIGLVKYVDYEKDTIAAGNLFFPIFSKRKSFEPEKELRACIWTPDKMGEVNQHGTAVVPKGLTAQCDTSVLIEKLLIAPTTPEWAADVIKAVCSKYERSFPIEKSSIMSPAIF